MFNFWFMFKMRIERWSLIKYDRVSHSLNCNIYSQLHSKMAAATTEPKTRKLRDDLDQAHNFYEDWMEPDWQPSTAASSTSGFRTAPNKERSKFKFAKEYDRDLSTGWVLRDVRKYVRKCCLIPVLTKLKISKFREKNFFM